MGRKPTGPADAFSEALHSEIRARMARRRINQQHLADLAGISKSRISKTVFNSDAPLTTNELSSISEALEVSVLDLVVAAERALKLSEANDRNNYDLAALDDNGEPDVNEDDYL